MSCWLCTSPFLCSECSFLNDVKTKACHCRYLLLLDGAKWAKVSKYAVFKDTELIWLSHFIDRVSRAGTDVKLEWALTLRQGLRASEVDARLYFSFRGSSLKAPAETRQKSGGAAPGRDKVLLITVWQDSFFQAGSPSTCWALQFMRPGAAPGLCKVQALSCLPSVPVLASVAEGHYRFLPNTSHTKHTIVCQDTVHYYGLIPEKRCLHKIPIRRFSICSGVLLLGALKRPTEPAKNQSATT